LIDDGDINIDDVTVLEHFFVGGNAVAHHLVNRGANRLGKTAIAQAGGNGFLHIDDMVVADLVEFGGGDAGLDVGADHVEHFGGHTASDAHFGEFVGGFDNYGHNQRAALKRCKGPPF